MAVVIAATEIDHCGLANTTTVICTVIFTLRSSAPRNTFVRACFVTGECIRSNGASGVEQRTQFRDTHFARTVEPTHGTTFGERGSESVAPMLTRHWIAIVTRGARSWCGRVVVIRQWRATGPIDNLHRPGSDHSEICPQPRVELIRDNLILEGRFVRAL